ncbi:acyl-CoA synthetase [Pseudosulfitobacter pseudonitzschiae]|uniref:acyl-CoA synthetase n=1 Tax=Pseudosulfitobacter pseudonitzschiae TaxID=1402135 RepID=UPI001AF9E709|nr:acyl-CoA synthetase [Pseudosulfitobacter pseudonitzschiae]MBM1813871.1 acyl-CoA synthetase [Pseudosulfitobacter pseudonitzschiae]MBM1830864.1 acyl-CoA synthetase [Pseudosulfitobacter pseudonitzschiae]MBM1835731.1 acyl-CoA synthetase [Pseudosulfitobacter pseudonitzschiae]MBM1840577.1 acyl-CoA synthetase [Pseudosulfitobacter pseudonitzschiae]MBM1845435.1 acyl-CoA synthetase [Pseudosulfitobacter pseudonitzschiae]
MTYAGIEDRKRIEAEGPWASRNVPVTLFGMLSDTAAKFPDHNAVSYQIFSGPKDKAETFTWRELKAKTAQTANMLRSMGIGPTDVVAYVLPNCNEAILTMLGGATAGIVNPINPLLDPEQIASILRETGAKVVVTLRAFPKTDVADKVASAVAHAPGVKTVLEVDLLRYVTPPKSWIIPLIRPKSARAPHADYLSFSAELKKHNTSLDFEDVQQDRVACYFHTGGTTGMPKVAQHRYSGLVYNGWVGGELLLNENDVLLCPLPLFHVMAVHVILMGAVFSGAHVVFPTPQGYRGEGVFDNIWKLTERWKITFIVSVPTALAAMMQRPIDADVSTVKTAFSGSAPLPKELFKRFEEATGVTIVEGYGMTEATCLVSGNPVDGLKKIGSIGIPFPYTDVKIIKQTNEGPLECAVDEIGEICIANPGVYTGHTYTEEAKNKDLFYNDTHLRTGDLGRMDSDGYLWITGRAKDLIIRGGHNIDPAEIEDALQGHKAVAFAGAIGQPDAHSGEVPCAYVELVDGATVTEAELMEYCKKHVHERAAQPKHMTIMDELPKTAVGKVFKPDLRKNAITRVYNAALSDAGLKARVTSVLDDKKRGLTAQVAANGDSQEAIGKVLGPFIQGWELETQAVAAE